MIKNKTPESQSYEKKFLLEKNLFFKGKKIEKKIEVKIKILKTDFIRLSCTKNKKKPGKGERKSSEIEMRRKRGIK